MLPILYHGAALFQENLANKVLLFIGQGDINSEFYSIEVLFEYRNYLHFTGCKPIKSIPAEAFFKLCLSRRLSLHDFTTVSQTSLKMEVLESLMRLPYTAKMIGNFSGTGDFLYTEKLAGNVRGCMGFCLGDRTPYYSPNTVLRADVRNLTEKPRKLLAVYAKPMTQATYDTKPIMLAKELQGRQLIWSNEIQAKLNSSAKDF